MDETTQAEPAKLLTVDDLGIPKSRKLEGAPETGIWDHSQKVEPMRDGVEFCTWEMAEHLLVSAAVAANRGIDMAMRAYALLPDEAVMVLRLVIA